MQTSKQPAVRPIQLISFDGDKRLVLSDQAVRVFSNLEAEQLYIVTVAGKYRTGKSYILNRVLLNQNSGFEVGPTINACTKGLWMWPKIVQIKYGDTIKKCIIIDTQGLGSLQEGQNTDIKIFLMAILLSSYLIYNSVGSIDEKAIENLSLVINLAQLLHKNQNQYDSQQLINSFPSFMWLVRDFSLRLQNQKGQPISSQQYLQNALRYQNSNSQAAQKKNSIRKKLKTFFQDRNCFTLVRPTQNEKDLQNLSTLSQKRLRPQFVRLINDLRSLICQSLRPKKVRGKSVTPQGFIQLCKYFVSTINSGKLPSINSHWDNLCLKQASRIIQTICQQHSKKLSQSYCEQDEIDQKFTKIQNAHKILLIQAHNKIDKSFLGKLQKQLCKQKMDKMLTKNYELMTKQINEKRYNFVKEIVRQIFTEIMDQFHNNKLQSFQQIFARFQEIKQKYKHDSRIYQSFYQNSKDVFQQFLKSLKQHWERQQSVLNQKNFYLETIIGEKATQMKEKISQNNQKIRQLQSKNYRIQLQNGQLNALVQQLKKQILGLKQQNQKICDALYEQQASNEKDLVEQLQLIKQKMKQQITQLQTQLHRTEIELAKSKQFIKQSNIKQRKNLRQMEIFKSKCSQYLKQNIQLNQKLQIANKKIIQLEQLKRKQFIKDISINSQVPQIVKTLNKKINELQIKINAKEEQNRNLSCLLNSQKITQQVLLKAPQNLNYSVLKKNYETQTQANKALTNKIGDFELIFSMYSLKCLLCNKKVDKKLAKSHLYQCSASKSITFDVSYEYNGQGEIQFIVDVYLDDQQWTVRKTVQNVRHFLKKMSIQTQLFKNMNIIEEDIALNEERRLYLDQLFNDQRNNIWNSLFLIQYFGVDLHYLNCKSDVFKGSSMKGSKVSIDLDNVLQQNIQPVNMLMKTTKFSKKTFNFGNI